MFKGSKSQNFFNDNFYIFGEFDGSIATEIIPNLVSEIKKKKDTKNPSIVFYINSLGGYVNYLKDLLGLIELAKSDGIKIETYVMSNALSCGSMLAASGSVGHRYISAHAVHLCHLGGASTGFVINDIELKRAANFVERHFDFVRDVYTKYAKIKDLEKVIHDDLYYLYGQEIIDNGLADKFMPVPTE